VSGVGCLDERGTGTRADVVDRTMKAKDFEGAGGPEDKEAIARDQRGGDDDV
jgi:hypothetical protein